MRERRDLASHEVTSVPSPPLVEDSVPESGHLTLVLHQLGRGRCRDYKIHSCGVRLEMKPDLQGEVLYTLV